MDGTGDRALVSRVDQVSYGLAEFVAAEEMDRMRGHWWSPDGGTLLVARVDETPVQRWHIADPANPDRPPSEIAYPAAGTPNALVSLVLLKVDGGASPSRGTAASSPTSSPRPGTGTACWSSSSRATSAPSGC